MSREANKISRKFSEVAVFNEHKFSEEEKEELDHELSRKKQEAELRNLQEVKLSEESDPQPMNCFKANMIRLALCCAPVAQRAVDIGEDIASAAIKAKIESNPKLSSAQKQILIRTQSQALKVLEKAIISKIGEWAEKNKKALEGIEVLSSAAKFATEKAMEHLPKGDLEKDGKFEKVEVFSDDLPPLHIITTKKLEDKLQEIIRKSKLGPVVLKSSDDELIIDKKEFAEIIKSAVKSLGLTSRAEKALLNSEAAKGFAYMLLEQHNKLLDEHEILQLTRELDAHTSSEDDLSVLETTDPTKVEVSVLGQEESKEE